MEHIWLYIIMIVIYCYLERDVKFHITFLRNKRLLLIRHFLELWNYWLLQEIWYVYIQNADRYPPSKLVVKVRASNQSTNDLSVPSNFTERCLVSWNVTKKIIFGTHMSQCFKFLFAGWATVIQKTLKITCCWITTVDPGFG